MRWRLLSTTLLLSCAIYPGKGIADQCEKLDKEGLLIYQQFKKSKMCKDSTINAGWTDCLFKAYGTNILLSVDERAKVRTFIDRKLGLLLRVDGKDNVEKSGCIYNEVFITLDARVLAPGEFNKLTMGIE